MKKFMTIAALAAITLSATSAAKAQDSRSAWVYMKGGTVTPRVFQAVHNRCTQIGSNAYQSTAFSGLNFSTGGFNNVMNNLQTVFQSQTAKSDAFNNCMAQHGFYPR